MGGLLGTDGPGGVLQGSLSRDKAPGVGAELAERPQKGEGSGCRSARFSLETFRQEGAAPASEGT